MYTVPRQPIQESGPGAKDVRIYDSQIRDAVIVGRADTFELQVNLISPIR